MLGSATTPPHTERSLDGPHLSPWGDPSKDHLLLAACVLFRAPLGPSVKGLRAQRRWLHSHPQHKKPTNPRVHPAGVQSAPPPAGPCPPSLDERGLGRGGVGGGSVPAANGDALQGWPLRHFSVTVPDPSLKERFYTPSESHTCSSVQSARTPRSEAPEQVTLQEVAYFHNSEDPAAKLAP